MPLTTRRLQKLLLQVQLTGTGFNQLISKFGKEIVLCFCAYMVSSISFFNKNTDVLSYVMIQISETTAVNVALTVTH